MSSHLTPLEVCERLIAPLAQLGEKLNLKPKAAYAWRKASEWRDAGDMPPRVNRRALKYASKHNIPLKPEHLIAGAKRDEIDDLVQAMRQDKVAAE